MPTVLYVATQNLELVVSGRRSVAAEDLLDGVLLVLPQFIGKIHLKSEIKVTKAPSASSRHSLPRNTHNMVTFCYAINIDGKLVTIQVGKLDFESGLK